MQIKSTERGRLSARYVSNMTIGPEHLSLHDSGVTAITDGVDPSPLGANRHAAVVHSAREHDTAVATGDVRGGGTRPGAVVRVINE